MSSAFDGLPKTPNLKLNKPGYDNVADIEALNENADILDAEIQGIKNTFVKSVNGINAGDGGNVDLGIIPISQGGTGASTAEQARTNLGIKDIATYDVLPIANGGTGANNASQACANIGAVQKVNNIAPDSNGNVNVASITPSEIVDLIYPVGSIYMSMSATNPAELFGGTWEQIAQGRCLIGAGTGTDSRSEKKTFTAGATGGEYNHVLTVGELASHGHGASIANTSITGYFGSVVRGDRPTATIANGVFSDVGSIGSKTANANLSSEAFWRGTNLNATHSHTITVNSNGSNTAHNNIMPYLSVYYFKRTA